MAPNKIQQSSMLSLLGALVMIQLAGAAGTDSADRSSIVSGLIQTIQSVGPEGTGHAPAIRAVGELQQADVSVLPDIVKAFDDASPLAANWLRGSFEAIADRATKSGKPLPVVELEKLVRDIGRNPRARRLTYEWLLKADPELPERMLAQFLEDPSPEFRRDAVARLLNRAATHVSEAKNSEAIDTYRDALRGAVDNDQVEEIVAALETLGETVDLQRHFGYLTSWHLIGPFENLGRKGFDATYPPEKVVDHSATYDGQLGPVQWQSVTTHDDYGLINIAEQFEDYKGSAMYAQTEFVSEKDQEVVLRLSTPNAWKLWLNGKLLFAREEYHRGTRLDQYRIPTELQRGTNMILLKVLQNEQMQNWAQQYEFRLRVCDATGSAVASHRD